jgi:hypothetical protein
MAMPQVTYLPRSLVAPLRNDQMDQKVASANAIALCTGCRPKFDFKRYNYVPATRWGRLSGTCDGCRHHSLDQTLFIHESGVCDPNGRIRSGHVYTPE